ncbi:MAG: binding excisionase protein [Candidatus Magasanikbacteria bacterium GW2011_GWC2_34_16]|uniref:Binding excisionase protein n=2 Tax=Candidatus Magasanikiibacteriota TaxID=1752731 RepID=A0A0G0JS66_9BACT|nr:MAG: binding excisionase protein [Candidatus Magasanikbacteria bacterium GW2011_GWC2_34_16]KKQ39749.1 MAG: binding excisionase protein [Candidatus Magasanikbacteria bacterium GW2011_GWA2_37_8]
MLTVDKLVNIVYNSCYMMKENNKFITTAELANLLGISRIAVFKKIQNGKIKAVKKGRNYVINTMDVSGLNDRLSVNDKKIISAAVDRTMNEYGETLRLLGKE